MFKVSRSRSSAIHQPSNAAYAGGAPAGNAESAAASLVVDAAWGRNYRVCSLFSLDYLTSRALTRYVRLAFLFAIAIPRLHRSLSPLVPV